MKLLIIAIVTILVGLVFAMGGGWYVEVYLHGRGVQPGLASGIAGGFGILVGICVLLVIMYFAERS